MKQVDLQGNVWDLSVGNFEPPISAYGSVDLHELNQVMERLNKIPNYDELIRNNNKKQKEIERLNNIIDEIRKITDEYYDFYEYGEEEYEDLMKIKRIIELKEGK